MAYITTNNMEVSMKTPPYVPGGIQENLKLTDVRYETTTKGNKFLAFTFKDSVGKTVTHTEWPTKSTDPKEILDYQDKQVRRIGQIVDSVVGLKDYNINVNSFEEYAQTIVELLAKRNPEDLYRVKVVYNNKGFTTLPSYWKPRFIESMKIPKEESNIVILTNDKVIRPIPDVVSTDGEVDLDLPIDSKDKLPF